jgi:DNA-(apurinic or apyrimidinic site) lyase (EC 4.2.99.18)/Formamidopyrimidine-DNA glycosylase (EC 3.2.2.23)
MFQLQLLVYGRTDEPCKTCGTPLTKQLLVEEGLIFVENVKNNGSKIVG